METNASPAWYSYLKPALHLLISLYTFTHHILLHPMLCSEPPHGFIAPIHAASYGGTINVRQARRAKTRKTTMDISF